MKYLLDENRYTFSIREMLFDANKLWFTDSGCNEIYIYDISTQKVEFLVKLEGEATYQSRLVGDLIIVEDKLYAIPFSAQSLYEIDLVCKKVNRYAIETKSMKKYEKYLMHAKFNSVHRYNNCIYLVGATYPAIIEYNYLTKEVHYFDEWVDECFEFFNKEESLFFNKSILVGNKIFAPSCKGNAVLEFDIDKKTSLWHEVGSVRCAYSSIIVQEDWFWLSPRGKGPIVKWHIDTKQWFELDEFPVGYEPCEGSFRDVLYFNGYLYYIPMCASQMLRMKLETEEIEIYMQDCFESEWVSACTNGEQLFIYLNKTFQLWIADKSGKIEHRKLIMPEPQNSYHKIRRYHISKVFNKERQIKNEEQIFYEKYSDELCDYLDYVKKKDLSHDDGILTTMNGSKIYHQN